MAPDPEPPIMPGRADALDSKLRRALLILLYLAIAWVAVSAGAQLRAIIGVVLNVLSPFFVAAIVAYIFNPIVLWLQARLRLGRLGGVVVTYVFILALAAGTFSLVVPVLYFQLKNAATSFVQAAPVAVEKTRNWLRLHVGPDDAAQFRAAVDRSLGFRVSQWFTRDSDDSTTTAAIADDTSATLAANPAPGAEASATVTSTASVTTSTPTATISQQSTATTRGPLTGALAGRVAAAGQKLGGFFGNTLAGIVGAFAFGAFVMVITFYFLIDYGRAGPVARTLLPPSQHDRFFALWRRIDAALGGFLRGQLIVALIVGSSYAVALFLLGMSNYALLIGFAAGFGNLIPYLGPIVGGVPAALWVLLGDAYPTAEGKLIGIAIVILIGVAVQALDGFFLQPRIVGASAELHPLLVLLALLVGAEFGLGGLILAVPTAIIARVLIKEFWWDPLVAARADGRPLKQKRR